MYYSQPHCHSSNSIAISMTSLKLLAPQTKPSIPQEVVTDIQFPIIAFELMELMPAKLNVVAKTSANDKNNFLIISKFKPVKIII